MRKSSTCGFDFTDYGMLGGSRPGPVNRHGFEIAGSAGARLAPIMGPAPAGWSLGGWRPVGWKRKPASGGTREALGAPGRRAAAAPPARGARPAGGRRRRRPPPRRPQGLSGSAARRFSLPPHGPPSAQRPSRRRRAHYRGQSRSRRPGDFKTMPVYGARPGTPEHAVIGKIKTAGRRLAHSAKCRVWTAGPGPAP